MLPKKLAFLDLETTGGSLSRDRILEIGLIKVIEGQVIDQLSTVIDPGCWIPPEIVNLTGITEAEVSQAPTFRQIKDQLLELLEDCIVVAHNARFDYGFLKSEFKRVNVNFSAKLLCTVKLSRAFFPSNFHHNLDSIIERFRFNCERRHRALDDAQVLWQFYQKINQQYPLELVTESVNKIINKQSLPIKLPAKILSELPASPGVYIFYGKNNLPLYIGKSINIKKRVTSHFQSDYKSPLEMKISQSIENIDYIQTPGELGALFKESTLIKALQPLYNRKLRHQKKIVIIKLITSAVGCLETQVLEKDQIDLAEISDIVGVFKNKRSAKDYLTKLAKDYSLCKKYLGLEKTSGPCFNYHLGRCKGVCIGQENFQIYNLKVASAVVKDKLKPWPFKSPILILEGQGKAKSEGFLIDRWCLLGTVKFSHQDQNLKLESEVKFDLDIYKILSNFLKNPQNQKKIKVINQNQLRTFYSV